MKSRKKTKLCLQCNGVNPISASHCAYCGAILATDEPLAEESPAAPTQTSMGDLFANPKEMSGNSPYTASRGSHPFVPDREPVAPEENVNKPLYSVFDQPQNHQMGDLSDELMEKPSNGYASTSSDPISSNPEVKTSPRAEPKPSKLRWNFSAPIELLCTSALSMGTLLIVLSLLTLLFEHNGRILLSWSSHAAPWLFMISAALLGTGWYALGPKSKAP